MYVCFMWNDLRVQLSVGALTSRKCRFSGENEHLDLFHPQRKWNCRGGFGTVKSFYELEAFDIWGSSKCLAVTHKTKATDLFV